MNLKVANLIAVEFGIFIGMMSWLAYSRLPSDEPRTAAEMQESTVEPFATVAPVHKPENQRPYTVDYRADRERARLVNENPARLAQAYDQEIASQPYASSGLENGSIAADSPSYAEADQESVVVSPDYVESPQTVAYVQPTQFIVYSQPQFVVFANRHRFPNRCRPAAPLGGAHMATTHRCPDRPRSHQSGSTESRPTKSLGIVPRPIASATSCRPTEGFRSQGNR